MFFQEGIVTREPRRGLSCCTGWPTGWVAVENAVASRHSPTAAVGTSRESGTAHPRKVHMMSCRITKSRMQSCCAVTA